MRLFRISLIALFASAPAVWADSATYKYDPQGRLSEVDYANGTVIKYSYDQAGNRTQETVSCGANPC